MTTKEAAEKWGTTGTVKSYAQISLQALGE